MLRFKSKEFMTSSVAIDDYYSPLDDYVCGRIDELTFESRFYEVYNNEDDYIGDYLGDIIDEILQLINYLPVPYRDSANAFSSDNARSALGILRVRLKQLMELGFFTRNSPSILYPLCFASCDGIIMECTGKYSPLAYSSNPEVSRLLGMKPSHYDETLYMGEFEESKVERWWFEQPYGWYKGEKVSIYAESTKHFLLICKKKNLKEIPDWRTQWGQGKEVVFGTWPLAVNRDQVKDICYFKDDIILRDVSTQVRNIPLICD